MPLSIAVTDILHYVGTTCIVSRVCVCIHENNDFALIHYSRFHLVFEHFCSV